MFKGTDKGIILGKTGSGMIELNKRDGIIVEPKGEISNFALGILGQGKAIHPWDNLKLCECGGSPWMEGKNGGNFEEGEPYRIRCCKCGKYTVYGNVQEIKNDWNSNKL